MHQTDMWDRSFSAAATVSLSNQVYSSRQLEQEVSHDVLLWPNPLCPHWKVVLVFSHFPTH